MTNLPPIPAEAVEAAAKVLWEHKHPSEPYAWEDVAEDQTGRDYQDTFRYLARAAILAADEARKAGPVDE